MNNPVGIPQEMRDAADAAARALAIAKLIQVKQYPDGGAPDNLLPVLMLGASIALASGAVCGRLEAVADRVGEVASNAEATGADVCNRIEGVAGAIETLSDPRLNERLAGVEEEIHRLGNLLIDLKMSGALSPRKEARGDGTK